MIRTENKTMITRVSCPDLFTVISCSINHSRCYHYLFKSSDMIHVALKDMNKNNNKAKTYTAPL